MASELPSLEPWPFGHGGQAILCNVYEGLVAFDARMRVVPALAERWESPDELTWRFFLRAGVLRHDGRPLAAADVVASLERSRPAMVASVASPAAGVVDIRTLRPEPMLLNDLVPSFIALPPAGTGGALVGAGPYRVTSFEPGRSLELAAFEGYWRGAPAVPTLRFVFESDPAGRERLLADGAVDVALRLPESARDAAGFRLSYRAAPGARLLALRVDRAPFDDLRVRQAIDLALDRGAIAHDVLAGRARPMGQFLPQGFFGSVPGLEGRPRDLAAARRLVAVAGQGRGIGFELTHGSGRKAEAEALAAQLADAGFRVRLRSRSAGEISGHLETGDFAAVLWSLISYTADASDVFTNVLHSRDEARGLGRQNTFGYRDAALDRLIERAVLARGLNDRSTLFQEATRLAVRDLAVVPLWEVPWVTGVRDDVDYVPSADGWFRATSARRR